MKKLLFAFITLTFCQCAQAQDRIIEKNELPTQAISFLNENFAKDKISLISSERELIGKDYKVILVNGTKIDFDSKGNWKEVECKKTSSIPSSMVPANINLQIKSKFPDNKIVKIDRSNKNTEIELNNGIELEFNKKGKLVKFDD